MLEPGLRDTGDLDRGRSQASKGFQCASPGFPHSTNYLGTVPLYLLRLPWLHVLLPTKGGEWQGGQAGKNEQPELAVCTFLVGPSRNALLCLGVLCRAR